MNRRGLGTKYDNSRHIHYFSQSLLNTFQQCPEQARHELLGDVPRVESPKMALGTAGHAAIEAKLKSPGISFDMAAAIMLHTFEERTYLSEYVDDEKLGMDWAKKRGVSALNAWWEEVLPQVDPAEVEKPFEYLLYSDAQRQIYMKGTIDCIDTKNTVWDWKFSGSERKAWKDARGSIQAAAYTKAAGVNRFNYAVMHEKGVQIVDLWQGEQHWNWLASLALPLAHLIEAGLPVWPRNDTDWWCNVNWCSVYADGQCKGQIFPAGFGQGRK